MSEKDFTFSLKNKSGSLSYKIAGFLHVSEVKKAMSVSLRQIPVVYIPKSGMSRRILAVPVRMPEVLIRISLKPGYFPVSMSCITVVSGCIPEVTGRIPEVTGRVPVTLSYIPNDHRHFPAEPGRMFEYRCRVPMLSSEIPVLRRCMSEEYGRREKCKNE